MASSLDYVQYVCDQMREAGEITYKKCLVSIQYIEIVKF